MKCLPAKYETSCDACGLDIVPGDWTLEVSDLEFHPGCIHKMYITMMQEHTKDETNVDHEVPAHGDPSDQSNHT